MTMDVAVPLLEKTLILMTDSVEEEETFRILVSILRELVLDRTQFEAAITREVEVDGKGPTVCGGKE